MELQEYGLDSTLLLVYLGGLNGINFLTFLEKKRRPLNVLKVFTGHLHRTEVTNTTSEPTLDTDRLTILSGAKWRYFQRFI